MKIRTWGVGVNHNEKDEIIKELITLRSLGVDVIDSTRRREFINADPLVSAIAKNSDYELFGINIGISKKIDEVTKKYEEMQRGIIKTVNRMQFYYNHIIRERDGYDIEFHDDLTHNEDDLFHITVDYIRRHHSFNISHVDFHKRIDGIEFDCIVRGSTFRDKYARVIGVEFKDADIETVVQQAIIRADYTNVQYVVVNTSIGYIFEKRPGLLVDLKSHKIGLICIVSGKNEDIPVMILPSEIRRKTKLKFAKTVATTKKRS